jgi:hypothetical protein
MRQGCLLQILSAERGLILILGICTMAFRAELEGGQTVSGRQEVFGRPNPGQLVSLGPGTLRQDGLYS